jgi:hypothetical protein
MLAQQPATVLRLFEGGLSSAGYLRAIRDRFWNLLEYSSIERIKRIWTERETLELGVMERFALIANKFAHGSIDERPWAGSAPAEAVLKTFQYGMFNLVYLFSRIMKSGVDEGPIVKALAYLLLLTVRDHNFDRVLETFSIALRTESDRRISQEAVRFLVMPVLESLQVDFGRVSRDDSVKFWEDRDPLDSYWSRFGTRGIPPRADKGAYHRLERTSCAVWASICRAKRTAHSMRSSSTWTHCRNLQRK